ncbi:class I SAM-dependent methyltransferase [Luteibacter sp.]|uniref:class I SAM-dependent methyltransferase n=1 Tax=Luteibacter sp. TaxID=1886636 RepID=UPI003F7E69A2
MTVISTKRQGHAQLDLRTREAKSRKIARILGISDTGNHRLLEVGTGAGGIAHYFATQNSPAFDVDAVDVVDSRQVSEGYRFQCVEGTALPFADDTFDLVVSNHVIEHVGERPDQLHHLQEIRRVLRPGGKVYLAVPNRWMLIEPHYHLVFLSWLPKSWRTPYLRASGRGSVYDCEPLRRAEVDALAEEAGFVAQNASIEALRAFVDIEPDASRLARLIARLPNRFLRPLEGIISTHVYVLELGA